MLLCPLDQQDLYWARPPFKDHRLAQSASLLDSVVPCLSAAIWRYVVNESGKVTDIYFLTQLTPDEKVSMVSPASRLASCLALICAVT